MKDRLDEINEEFDEYLDYLSRKEKNLKLLTNFNLDFDDDFDLKF
jgi:hypothetical protein